MPEYRVFVNGKQYDVNIGRMIDDRVDVMVNGKSFQVELEGPRKAVSKTPRIETKPHVVSAAEAPDKTTPPGIASSVTKGDILAPLPGLILKLMVKEGDQVREGQPVAIMEAMKMENEIESPFTGVVTSIPVKQGDTVLENALLMKIGS